MLEAFSDAIPAVEVKTAGGISLETPRLTDITGEEGLKMLVEPLQFTITQVEDQIEVARNWNQRRQLQKQLKTYRGFLDFVNGVPLSHETSARFLMYAAKEAAESQTQVFTILTEGKIDPSAPPRESVDLEVEYEADIFHSPEDMQAEYSTLVKQTLVWENTPRFRRTPDLPPSTTLPA